MEARVNMSNPFSHPGYQALLAIETYLHKSTIPQPLLHLLKLRASQINGCAYCIDMHWKDLRALGEPEARLYGLDAWRESSQYTEKERAALEWTEAVTLISQTHAPDDAYARLREHFSEAEFIDLTFLLAAINAWNRLAISTRSQPGHYKSTFKPVEK